MEAQSITQEINIGSERGIFALLKHNYYRRIERQECEPLAHATVRRFSTSLCRIIVRLKKVLNLRGLQM